MEIELEDRHVVGELKGCRLTLIFGNRDDAERFWIALSESARLGAKLSFTPQLIADAK